MGLTKAGEAEILMPTDPAMRFIRNQREMKFTMPFEKEQLGMIATYYGRWETRMPARAVATAGVDGGGRVSGSRRAPAPL
jgi:hypothetical protein